MTGRLERIGTLPQEASRIRTGEMTGSITWLGPDMKTKLSAINISGVRLVSLTKKKGGRFFEAELSVNKMNLKSF